MVHRLLGRVLDATLVASYTRAGFAVRKRTWAPVSTPVSLAGHSYAVTGANSGIGQAVAEGLARRGATVRLLCRDGARGALVRDRLAARYPKSRVVLDVVDVSKLADVREFARRYVATGAPLHGLVHNAGVLPRERSETFEGIETSFATNVLGPFVLTQELLPALAASGGARVVFVSSGGMIPVGLRADDFLWTKRPWDGVRAYAETKRAEVVLAHRFAERHRLDGSVTFHSMHPGWVDTPALANALPRFHAFWKRWLRTPEQGADTVVWLLATEEPVGSGRFWFDRLPRRTHLPLRSDPVSAADADALWSACERLSRQKDLQ